jgi:hypothetical protein
MKLSGKELMHIIREELRVSGFLKQRGADPNELPVRGWTSNVGDTGFSVKQNNETEVEFHVVVDGRVSGLRFEARNGSRGLHDPANPNKLIPRIAGIFDALGVDVKNTSCSGWQTEWGHEVSYTVTAGRPEFLVDRNDFMKDEKRMSQCAIELKELKTVNQAVNKVYDAMTEIDGVDPREPSSAGDDILSGLEAEKRRADQMTLNFDWLLQRMDTIHNALCPGENGTWQVRATQAVAAAREMREKINNAGLDASDTGPGR